MSSSNVKAEDASIFTEVPSSPSTPKTQSFKQLPVVIQNLLKNQDEKVKQFVLEIVQDKENLGDTVIQKNNRIMDLLHQVQSHEAIIKSLNDLVEYKRAEVQRLRQDLYQNGFKSTNTIHQLQQEMETLRKPIVPATHDKVKKEPRTKTSTSSSHQKENDYNVNFADTTLTSDDTVRGSDSDSFSNSSYTDISNISSASTISAASLPNRLFNSNASESPKGIKSMLRSAVAQNKTFSSAINAEVHPPKHRLVTRLQQERKSVSYESLSTIQKRNPATGVSSSVSTRNLTLKKQSTKVSLIGNKIQSSTSTTSMLSSKSKSTVTVQDQGGKSAIKSPRQASALQFNKLKPKTTQPLGTDKPVGLKKSSTTNDTGAPRTPCGVINSIGQRRLGAITKPAAKGTISVPVSTVPPHKRATNTKEVQGTRRMRF